MRTPKLAFLVLLIAVGTIRTNTAAESAAQSNRLDADLTTVGAERAGNADGSIPAWTGGLPKAPPIDPKIGYLDPFADDKPLVTITATNTWSCGVRQCGRCRNWWAIRT